MQECDGSFALSSIVESTVWCECFADLASNSDFNLVEVRPHASSVSKCTATFWAKGTLRKYRD